MNIIKYYKRRKDLKEWNEISKGFIRKMEEHQHDEDDTKFKFYAKMNCFVLKKILDIQTQK